MKTFLIVVEGIADEVFISQYFRHIFGNEVPDSCFVKTDGKDNRQTAMNRMREMSANGGINLVIFDADKDIDKRRTELLKWKKDENLDFELFLMPNDKDSGALEELLENIINPNNRPIMECWENYEKELVKLDIPGRTPPPLTTPAKKTKIYGYLEALLKPSEKESIKERKRKYYNTLHWNFDDKYLEPLKEFLSKHLK
ncbi:MAG: hypothetical protein J1E57_00215 [Prevotella sp.]|nr:hypothetical protein [Prevotella sp.]